jgi:hypothetical protein
MGSGGAGEGFAGGRSVFAEGFPIGLTVSTRGGGRTGVVGTTVIGTHGWGGAG